LEVIAIVQARMGSTRLPGKVMMKVKGKSILYYVIERIKKSKLINQIIIATTTNKNDDIIVKEAKKLNVDFFRGSENDVLSRYYFAAKKTSADIIVRITSDCPLIDYKIVDKVIKRHLDASADYTANVIKRTYPRGFDTEVFNFNTLEKSYNDGEKNYHREHVTKYITEHPEKFNIVNVEAKGKMRRPDIRITVDTEEDFKLIKEVILHFNNISFEAIDIIEFLNENTDLLEINKNVKQKEVNHY